MLKKWYFRISFGIALAIGVSHEVLSLSPNQLSQAVQASLKLFGVKKENHSEINHTRAYAHIMLEQQKPSSVTPSIEEDGQAHELLQWLITKEKNIFVSSHAWNQFCKYYDFCSKSNISERRALANSINPREWDMYQTPCGLFYLTPASSLNKTYFNTKGWHQVPMQIQYLKPHPFNFDLFKSIFSSDKSIDWAFYLIGHGSPTYKLPNGELLDKYSGKATIVWHNFFISSPSTYIGGVESSIFKKVLSFLGEELNTQQIIINSCYVYPGRILELLEKKTLPYDLITATANHQQVRLGFYSFVDAYNHQKLQNIIAEPFTSLVGIKDHDHIKNILFNKSIMAKPAFLAANTNYLFHKR